MEQERQEMTVAYFDCFSGAAGDMIVASLIDAGADEQALREGLSSLAVAGYTLKIEKIRKQGFAATRFLVELDSTAPQPHRHLADVVEIIRSGNLPDRVRQNSIEVFERLAKAEAQVHGTSVDKVHFHEVGAVDAIVDVVGAMLALQTLGVERVVCSPIPVGSGTVKCAHGVMPIPAPATAELLQGVPLAETDETGELITPTGAAVLTTLADEFGPLPAMSVSAIGYGAGTRDGAAVPNLLRVFLGAASDSDDADSVTVLETNLDDASGEIVGYTIERALQMGALD
ncbi:MAG: nickel pincer cofactor biosynthesis protein LarC, partial [Planctomycetes bacterium]|nr:nickel pincer cofactor biosynthesis protein LarC [Planctomycetota bacterium]